VERSVLDLQDTIAAIATAPGAAGLAVVRVSGGRALALADAVFQGGARLADAPGDTLHHGWARWPQDAGARPGPESVRTAPARDGVEAREGAEARAASDCDTAGARLDEVVAAVFRAPRSYTRQDVVEFSCHGGPLSAGQVLAALIAAGARLARPGEFTLRAFLNGRLDLVQAEAVADLIAAESRGAHALALAQLRGDLSRRLAAISERLRAALTEVEARVDFAEDVGGIEVPAEVIDAIAAAGAALERLLAGAAFARALREGVRVALVGRPNAGKSSLFNALLGERRAIVAERPGTTRDLVSEAIELAGVRVTLADTAGLQAGGDAVESEGVARARLALEESAAVLWVVDGAAALAPEDRWIAGRLAGRRVLVALNKRDLPHLLEPRDVTVLLGDGAAPVIEVSALRGDGVETLRAALGHRIAGTGGLVGAVANPRHAEALARARTAVVRAHEAGARHRPGEIVALELREALGAIGEVTGESVTADLLERIFRRFCVGK
jgi:tRNA modification GTPase